MLNKSSLYHWLAPGLLWLILASPLTAQPFNVLREYRIENDLNFSLLVVRFDREPDYEILPFLDENIINIKFKNVALPNSVGRQARFIDNLLAEAELSTPTEKEVWLKILTKFPEINYTVDAEALSNGIWAFRIARTPLDNSAEANNDSRVNLRTVLVKNEQQENLAFLIDQLPDYELQIKSLPELRLLLQIKGVQAGNQLAALDSEFIKNIEYRNNDQGVEIDITMFHRNLEIMHAGLKRPNQVLLQIKPSVQGVSPSSDDVIEFLTQPQLSTTHNSDFLKKTFAEAEIDFINLNYDQAWQKFRLVYENAPTEELGLKALYRAADSLDELQAQAKLFDGYQRVIRAYEQALDQTALLQITTDHQSRAIYKIGYNYQADGLFEEAVEYYQKLLNEFPQSYYVADALYQRAAIFIARKKYQQAIVELQDLLTNFPNNRNTAYAYYDLGLAFFRLGNFSSAYKYFIDGRSLNNEIPNQKPELLYAEAGTYFENKSYQQFINRSRQLIRLFPDDLLSDVAAIRLGDFYASEASDIEATSYYERAENSASQEVRNLARMSLANIKAESFEIDQYREALADYRDIYNQSSDENIKQEALMRTILAQTFHQDREPALASMSRYRELYPNGRYIENGALDALMIENISNLVAEAYLDERYSDVISQYVNNRRLINESQDQFLLWLLANSYSQLNNFQDANQFYQLLLNSNTPSRLGELNFEIADNYFLNNNFEQAELYFTEVVKNFPNTLFASFAQMRRSDIFALRNEYQRSIDVLEELISTNQNQTNPLLVDLIPEAWFKIGTLQQELGYYQLAFNAYKNVHETFQHALKDPQAPEFVAMALFASGDMSRELGAYDQAIAIYQQAIDYYPESTQTPWAKYYSASIYLEQQKYPEALASFNSLLEEPPEDLPYLIELAAEGKREIETNQNFAKYLRGDLVQ